MCWSAPVSFSFAALQFAAVIALLARNQHYDRISVVLVIPIMLQEFCQGMLWQYRGVDHHTCPRENETFTFLAAASWGSVTTMVCFGLYYVSDATPANRCRRNTLLILTSVAFLGYILHVWVYRALLMKPYCSYPGPCGHLNWGPATASFHPSWVKLVYYATYLFPLFIILPVTRINDGRKYKWWAVGGTFYGIVSLVPTWTYFNVINKVKCEPEEWSSMW